MRRFFFGSVRGAALVALTVGSSFVGGCADDFQPQKVSSKQVSLGDDIYSVFCDRVAASENPADIEGRYSHAVCHAADDGTYASAFDPLDGAMPPRLAVMVRYRKDLVEALNFMFPDKDSLHADLSDLLKEIVPLYDDDTIPEATKTLAGIMDSIGFNALGKPNETAEEIAARVAKTKRAKDVQAALARLGGRKGYRNTPIGVGVARPMLAYPKLDTMVDTAISKLGPGGDAEPELRKLLEVVQAEFDSSVVPPARVPIAKYADRFSGVLGARPKLTSEILRNVLVDAAPLKGDLSAAAYPATWLDVYARDGLGGSSPTLPYLLRDTRGYATFAILPTDANTDKDGLPVVDESGRFLAKTGKPLPVPTPFPVPFYAGTSKDGSPRDPLGRALTTAGGAAVYKYGDASKTMLHSALVDVKTLADPKNGALLDLAHAATYLFGPRSPADKTDRTLGPDGRDYVLSDGSKTTVKYRKYDGDNAAFTELVYAAARFFEFPKAGDYFELTRQLFRDHPREAARILGAALKIREIANKPEYAAVILDAKSGLWDDVIAVAIQIAQEPDLLHDVLESLSDPDVQLLAKGMNSFFANKDQLDYDPGADTCWAAGSHPDAKCAAINKPSYNVSKSGTLADPGLAVDLTTADNGDNRSLFQRFASLIHDAYGVRACNKPGATINTKISVGPITIPVSLPLTGTYPECGVLDVPDLSVFYINCIAGGINEATGHARGELPVHDSVVSVMKSILGDNAVDNILEQSSGIAGLKQVPTTSALNRLVMWRNPNKFINDLTAPIPSNVCPITDASTSHRTCASPADLMNQRQKATIFMGEYFDALKALRPVVLPFVKKRGADKTGREQLFIGLVSAMHTHWSQGKEPVRCDKTGTPATNPKYCYGDNVRQFEKLISEVFATDIIPALASLTTVTKGMTIRGSSGTDVMVSLVNDLINPNNSKGLVLTDRGGATATTTNDGRKIDQTTPFYLFANALNRFDASWVGPDGEKDHTTWKAARSKLVDQFLAVEAVGGDPAKSQLKNTAIAAAIPITVDIIEDRVEEHKAKGDLGTWTKTGLWKSFSESVSGPTFASAFDLQERLYADPVSRQALGDLLTYLADKGSTNDALTTLVTTTQDFLQVLADDADMVPIYHSLATGSAPDGAMKRSMDMIERLRDIETSDSWKNAHAGRRIVSKVMANAVTPMGAGRPSPIEVVIDCITDVNRVDATSTDAFGPEDYGAVTKTIEDFLIDPYRGMEQFYYIVKHRNIEQ